MTSTGSNLDGQIQPASAVRRYGLKVILIGECATNVFRHSMNRESLNKKSCAIFAGSFLHAPEKMGTGCVRSTALWLQQIRHRGKVKNQPPDLTAGEFNRGE